MTITNTDVFELHTALSRVAKVRLSSKVMWDMARNVRLIKGAFSDVEETRSRLVKTHDRNGDGTINSNDPEWPEFIIDLQSVMNTKVELELRVLTLPPEVLEEMDKALTIPPVVVAEGADAAAVDAAAKADETNALSSLNLKGALSLILA